MQLVQKIGGSILAKGSLNGCFCRQLCGRSILQEVSGCCAPCDRSDRFDRYSQIEIGLDGEAHFLPLR